MDSREYLVFNFYQFLCFFKSISVFGNYQGNGISKIMSQTAFRDQCILVMF